MASVRDSQAFRLNLVGIVALSLFVALFARLYSLQVLHEEQFQAAAVSNTNRTLSTEAPRGRILDSEGRILVDNKSTLVVFVDNFVLADQLNSRQEREQLALRLATSLSDNGVLTKVSSILRELEDAKYGPFDKIPVASGVTEEFKVWLKERDFQFPGVEIETESIRFYPYGAAASHVLGYIGPINQDELELRATSAKAYQPADEIGKAGVEAAFEEVLRGVPGSQEIIVDARNQIVGYGDILSPQPGSDVQLTIDIDLQIEVEEELKSQLEARRLVREDNKLTGDNSFFVAPAGAAVVLNPNGSQILAMASYPAYDQREFIGGISAAQFDALTNEDAHAPLSNRAIQGLYAPGSTFKPFTAFAAMNSGLMSDRGALTQYSELFDPGFFTLPGCDGGKCEFQNAQRTEYGLVDLRRALTVSSDVYFYRLAWFFEISPSVRSTALQDGVRAFGFGRRTGVPLAYEVAGLVPDEDLKAARHEDLPEVFTEGNWFAGDTLNTAIGQGDMGVTPLQLANAYATLANGGTLYSPNIAKTAIDPATREIEIDYQPRALGEIYLPPEIRDPLIDGLAGVTTQEDGTGFFAFETYPHDLLAVAGKTGTSEKFGKQDFALFAGFGPVENPEYVIVMVLEEAGFGSESAAPGVRNIFEALATNSIPISEPLDLDYLNAPVIVGIKAPGDELALNEEPPS